MTGTIVTVVPDRGYGFIKSPGQKDCFFHAKALTEGLVFGEHLLEQQVNFDVVEDQRGTRADLVRPAF